MTIFTHEFLKDLGLFGEVLVPTPIISPYPPGKIRFFGGKVQFSREELRPGGTQKKDIIITDPSYRTDPLTENDTAEKLFWNHLFRQGFNVFVWNGERIPVTNYQELMRESRKVADISTHDLLTKTQQSASLLYIVDAKANERIFNSLRHFDSKLIMPLQRLPAELAKLNIGVQRAAITQKADSFSIYSSREKKFNGGKLVIPLSSENNNLGYDFSINSPYLIHMLRPTRYRHPIFLPDSHQALSNIGLTTDSGEITLLINSQLKDYHYLGTDYNKLDINILSYLRKYDIYPQSLYLTGSSHLLSQLDAPALSAIIQSSPQLHSLSLILFTDTKSVHKPEDEEKMQMILWAAINKKSLRKIELRDLSRHVLLRNPVKELNHSLNPENLKEISFIGNDRLGDKNEKQKNMQMFLQKTINLETLDILPYTHIDSTIKANFSKLKELSLFLYNKPVALQDICFFFSDNNKISSLTLRMNKIPPLKGPHCKMESVKSLDLDLAARSAQPSNLLDFISLMPNLKKIHVTGGGICIKIDPLSDIHIEDIPSLVFLEELAVDSCHNDSLAVNLVHKAPALQKLTLTSLNNIENKTPYIPQLKDLIIINLSSIVYSWNNILTFLSKTPNLQSLDIETKDKAIISDLSFQGTYFQLLTNFECKPIDSNYVSACFSLLHTMPNIESLSLGLIHHNSKILSSEAEPPKLIKLKELSFTANTKPELIVKLVEKTPNLEHLMLFKDEQTPIFNDLITSIQSTHPYLTITFSQKTPVQASSTNIVQESNIKPKNLLNSDVSTHLSAHGTSVFDAHISPLYNRKSIYNILSLTNNGWQYFTDRIPLTLVHTVKPHTLLHFKHKNWKTTTGRVNVKLQTENCIPLISLTAYDQLKTFYSTTALTIYHSPTIHQYCVHGSGDTEIQYTVYYQNEKVLYPAKKTESPIRDLVASVSDLPSFITAVGQQYKNKPQAFAIDLAAYFNTFASNEAFHNTGKSPNDQLWQLFHTGHGVCMQRSIIYKHILDELNSQHGFNLPTQLVVSGPHAFVEVMVDGVIQKINLGGAVVDKYTETSRLPDLDLSAFESEEEANDGELIDSSANFIDNRSALNALNSSIKEHKKLAHVPYSVST